MIVFDLICRCRGAPEYTVFRPEFKSVCLNCNVNVFGQAEPEGQLKE
jgi:hypothetical protein